MNRLIARQELKPSDIMDIEKEIKISEHQAICFVARTELYELYIAMVKRWRLDKDYCPAFAASVFYTLGYTHGIRAERARRKLRRRKSAS